MLTPPVFMAAAERHADFRQVTYAQIVDLPASAALPQATDGPPPRAVSAP